jgi:succinoglycan biosynthesis protein
MAVGGAIYPVYETEEPEWMSVYTKALITAYKDEGSKIVRLRGSKFPSGGNAAYRREVFDRVGLFDTELGRKGTSLISGEEKAVFDKMKKLDMPIYYLPDMILYHIIPPSKLTKEYFDNLTLSIGKSEKLRTLSVSRAAYAKRIVEEIVKWGASILLCLGFCLQLSPGKGIKLLQFRFNVSKGLIAG